MLSVNAPGGMTLGSSCLPDPPAPMNLCCARGKPSILASANAFQSGILSQKAPYIPIHNLFERQQGYFRGYGMSGSAHAVSPVHAME